MTRHYSLEELLKLRESPLVVKPASLPPTEEWMGPPPDPTQNSNQNRGVRGLTRGKIDDVPPSDASSSRRPAFEARKSAPVPADIVLEPPRTAFASALGKNASCIGANNKDDETGTNDRKIHRDRYTREGQRHERDENNRREDRPSQPSNRRSVKDDTELWSGARQPRGTIFDDKDRSSRMNGERDYGRDKDGGVDRRDRGIENHRWEGNKEANGEHSERRNGPLGPLRSRDVASWSRDSDKAEPEEESKDRSRVREFRDRDRRGFREQDKGWVRGRQQDEDPLWLDTFDTKEDKRHAPTQADFEEFRAKMKAQDAKGRGSLPSPAEQTFGHDRAKSGGVSGSKGKSDIALDLRDLSDQFYETLSQPKKEKQCTNGQIEESRENLINAAAAKMAKSSKFSSLFSIDAAPKVSDLSPPPDSASSEDKAGFQRILKLLDQQQQPDPGQKTPPRPPTRQITQISPPMHSPPSKPQDESQPSAPFLAKTRDSEFLLNLMRQPQRVQQEPVRTNGGVRRDQERAPSMPPYSNFAMPPQQETMPQSTSSGLPPGFFEEPPRQEMPPRDKLNPNAPNPRNAPPGLFDLFNNPQRPSPANLPPGLERRPPGFDQLPPGFGQLPQHRQGILPPGFQRQGPHNGHHAIPPPGFGGPRSNGPGSMPPPPGFMNRGGPPPNGFASASFPHDGSQFGLGGGDFGFGHGFPPPGQQRR